MKALYLNGDLLVLFSVTLISVMGVTSIAPALPLIRSTMSISEHQAILLISAFTFPGIILAPFLGISADRLGRRRILIPSLIAYAAAGSACALTTSYPLLLLLRIIQGAGAAALGAVNQAIIGDRYEGHERIAALGYNSTVIGVGTMLFPVIGGLLADLSWRFPFLLSVLALPVALLLVRMKTTEPRSSVGMRLYLRNAFKQLRNRTIITAFIGTMAIFILLYGVLMTAYPFFLERSFQASPSTMGLILGTASMATIVGAFNLGSIARRLSIRAIVCWSFVIYTAALATALIVHTLALAVIPAILFGFANGINIPAIQSHLSASVTMEYRGVLMAVNAMVLRIGQTLGPIMTGAIAVGWGITGVLYAAIAFSLVLCVVLGVLFTENPSSTGARA